MADTEICERDKPHLEISVLRQQDGEGLEETFLMKRSLFIMFTSISESCWTLDDLAVECRTIRYFILVIECSYILYASSR